MERKIAFFLTLSLLISINSFASGEYCYTDAKRMPFDQVSNGFGYSVSTNGTKKILQKKSFKGELISELPMPENFNSISYSNDYGIYYYDLENKYNFYNYELKKSLKLPETENTTRRSFYESSIEVTQGSDKTIIFDQKKNSLVELKGEFQVASVIGDKPLLIKSENGKRQLMVTDGDVTEFQIPLQEGENAYSMGDRESKLQFSVEKDGVTKYSYIKTAKGWEKIESKENHVFIGTLSNGNRVFVNESTVSSTVVTPSGKNVGTTSGALFESHGHLFTMDLTGKYKIYPADAEKMLLSNSPPAPTFETSNSQFTKNGDALLIKNKNGMLIVDKKNNQTYQLDEMGDFPWEIKRSPDGTKFLLGSNAESFVFDIESRTTKKYSNQDYVQFSENFDDWMDGSGFRREKTCIKERVTLIDDDCKECARKLEVPITSDSVQALNLKFACESSGYSKGQWDSIIAIKDGDKITERDAELYLKRLQKEGRYANVDLSILVPILKSRVVEKRPFQVIEALKAISHNKPQLLTDLYRDFNLEKRIPLEYPKGESCRSKYESDEDVNVLNQLKEDLKQPERRTSMESLSRFLPFRGELSKLPLIEKNDLIDKMADQLALGASGDAEVGGIFPSKLYYFAKKRAMELFGATPKPATDLALSSNIYKQSAVVLSSSPLEHDKPSVYENVFIPNRFGFYIETLSELKLPEGAKQGDSKKENYSWKNSDGEFSADLTLTHAGSLKNIVPNEKSFDYKAMEKDGEFSGMMMIGTNMSTNPWLLDQYLTYYVNEGFKFEEPKEIKTLPFFEEKVKSGKLDYFIKEAHSDGDENNLFRIASESKILEGKRVRSDGIVERIYLIAPKDDKVGSRLLSNSEFGEWMRARKPDSPLVYFNSSCSSVHKVVRETASAKTSNFIPIPTANTTYAFTTHPENTMHLMLDAFRAKKDYDGIRKNMEKSPLYLKKSSDQFLFPDSKEYEDMIRKNLENNYDTEIIVKNRDGKVIHIDESIDH